PFGKRIVELIAPRGATSAPGGAPPFVARGALKAVSFGPRPLAREPGRGIVAEVVSQNLVELRMLLAHVVRPFEETLGRHREKLDPVGRPIAVEQGRLAAPHPP